jgi:hypothetical protein
MPLVYLPDAAALFLWGEAALPRQLGSLAGAGGARSATLVTPDGRRAVEGRELPVLDTAAALVAVPAALVASLPPSFGIWVLASKLALELATRERIVPAIRRQGGRIEARWAAALSSSEDAAHVAALARSMPPAAHAVPALQGPESEVWAPDALLRRYLDDVVDALVRAARGGPTLPREARRRRGSAVPSPRWDRRWQAALAGPERGFAPDGFAERSLVEQLERWSEPALGARDRLRACFRLELPEGEGEAFVLRFLLNAPDDPSLLVPASDVWLARGPRLEAFGRAFRDAQESLLEALGRAALLFPPLAPALEAKAPESLELDPAAAWSFLAEGAAALAEAGFGVIVPGELTASGARRMRMRMRVGDKSAKVAGVVSGAAGLGLDELIAVNWQAVIGNEALTPAELAALARQKAPLVRFRGAWVAVDPAELADIRRRIAGGPERIGLGRAVQLALAGEVQQGSLSVVVAATGHLSEVLERLQQASSSDREPPAALTAVLRPYQRRGQSWLAAMGSLGLGACLADDMGLGKTVQLLAHLLRRAEEAPGDPRPALLVAPTSVVGNWERELERFAPSLTITRHYGAERARTPAELATGPASLVLTTYGVLRRDAALLAAAAWSVVALDEAQNIKNSASATARAARGLSASQRYALTGTPVENRLAELWSISEFLNPGLLGPLETFRREFAVPIERYGKDAVAARLRRIVGPFILRRLKSDPNVIADLPAKHEMKVVCTLTREQATLYKAVVDEELRRIQSSEGIERRGRVLALLTATKQICNHPAQYLSERGPLPGRSGKLDRLAAMLEEALAAGDKALVFTQFREMGERLVAHLQTAFDAEIAFLHGGTSKAARDALVRRFQDEPQGPRVFVLSVKAGGTGLNLTAANHVFHYDRWWNPAVEDQATDRAYRIGQRRAVQVHKLLCAGTVEEKIDRLLESKRGLSAKVVGSGERWITELDAGELRELFALAKTAVIASDETTESSAAAAQRGQPAKPPETVASSASRRRSARSRREESA